MATSTMREVSAARSTSSDSDRIEKEAHRLGHATTTISLTPEQFEKLYLSPKTPRASRKATRFANAAPLGFMGGIFFFTGPLLLILSTIFLWIQAQTFFMLVCGLFSVFWLSFGVLQLPTLGLAAYYSPTGDAAGGAVSEAMNAVIALYLLVWGFALGTFFVFAIRINLIISGIFGFVTVGAWVLSGAY
ncbi:plasma membrane ammonium transporter (Ato3) [Pyrenophora seminiperda CCB06]|uniref:Plasma membrane ammonium transporter (Ato3) n=1 Tax=Pyrenophora seminiperda CCB06 TaxID=1302712 RepID=A0A3M7LV81_9PLEO|nr:plasma membrane ammonium transporter (Ato3) [Pyrenophora seminiperda CCB06]